MKLRKNKIVFNYILIVFVILSSTILFSNKTIEKGKTKGNNLKALGQEGQNYRLVTSADNVQVPVPKGYVASQVTGENYVTPEYQHTTITHKVSSTPTELTWSSPEGEQYPWTQDENGIWISGNQGIANSTSTIESEEFDYIKGSTLRLNYTYSCQNFWKSDYLKIYLINLTNNLTTEIVSTVYGGNTQSSFDYTTSNYTYTVKDWTTGRYKIKAIYSKNGNTDEGQDSGYIKLATYFKEDENGTETFEEDIKTKIHDGGFVIYQLSDEELEADPNGTSVIINDTNKDEAQTTRNQYVWIPVPNIEDILRTKIVNNGIMQFGQEYVFSDKSIKKTTYTDGGHYSEPRLVESYDKTKYYLQEYSNIFKRENFLNNMQEDFARMMKSINKYKGFYIGRYETGDDYEHSSTKKCFTNPRVVRYNSNIGNVTWYDSYKKLGRLSGKTEEYVETGMLFDSLWDYTLKLLNETDVKNYEELQSPKTWGNNMDNTKTVVSGYDNPAKSGAIETITYHGGIYSDSPTASNNIFDIAGNVCEWTMSRNYSKCRDIRGGYYCMSGYAPSYDTSDISPYEKNDAYGTRSMLLIR